MTFVSVILPVYNGERYVAEAIESVLAQTHRAFELLIVDDGSTDRTAEIAERFVVQDRRVHLIRHARNHGVAAALNTGLREARADWVTPLGHDDIMLSNRLAAQIAFHQECPEAVVFGHGASYINETGVCCGFTIVQPLFSEELLNEFLKRGEPVAVHHAMMHRRTILAIGGYSEKLRYSEDQDLWLRLLQRGYLIFNQTDVLTRYRIHSNSLTVQSAESSGVVTRWIEGRYAAWLKGHKEPPLAAFEAGQARRSLWRRLMDRRHYGGWASYRRAGTALVNRQWLAGTRNLATAFCLRPLYVISRLNRQRLKGVRGCPRPPRLEVDHCRKPAVTDDPTVRTWQHRGRGREHCKPADDLDVLVLRGTA